MNTQALLNPNRGVNESFAAYKSRRSNANHYVKTKLRGSVFWNSQLSGTYVREKTK